MKWPPCWRISTACGGSWRPRSTGLLEDGYDIRTVQELLGHRDVRTTMVYTHVLNRGGRGVTSPVDRLLVTGTLTTSSALDRGRLRPNCAPTISESTYRPRNQTVPDNCQLDIGGN